MNRRPAVTLIQALMAIFVMAIGLLALLTLFPLGALQMAQALQAQRAAETSNTATALVKTFDMTNDKTIWQPAYPGSGDVFQDPWSQQVLGVDRQDYVAVRSDVWINGTTPFGIAWLSFYNRTLANTFKIDSGLFANCPSYCFSQTYLGPRIQSVTVSTPYYKLTADWKAPKEAYDIVVRIYNDPDNTKPLVMPISIVRVLHGFVNIAIAEKGAEVSI